MWIICQFDDYRLCKAVCKKVGEIVQEMSGEVELIGEVLGTQDEDWLVSCAVEMTIRVEQPNGSPVDPRLVELHQSHRQTDLGVTVIVPQHVLERVRLAAGSQPSNSASAGAASAPMA